MGEETRHIQPLVKAAADARLALRAIGTVGIYSHCHQPHSWLNASTGYGSLEFGGLSAQAVPLAKLMTGLGYRANGELNVFYRGRRLVFDAPGWQYRVHIFLDSVGLYQRLDVSRFLSQESFSLSPTLLLLTRLQRMDVGEDELRELSVLLLDHEFDAGKGEGDRIGLGFIKSLCGEDWGWFKTAEVNLARLREAAPAWLDGEESTRLQQRLSEMQTAIERAPKTLRWRTRALLGDTIPWYHTPQEAPKAAPR